MTSTVAEYLKEQRSLFPETYGEIFLTNRYGVMIATTNKLSTLAHAHKYWWVASYNNSQGRTFFDDRGFDESVKGYVLGIDFNFICAISLHLPTDLSEEPYKEILPVCCVFGDIRDERGVEQGKGARLKSAEFFIERTSTKVTHTYCQTCGQNL